MAGQESALISGLEGREALPTFTPPLPFERGPQRRPTLVNNAETLAHLALIARHGAGWFRALGTPAHPGSALVTLSGPVAYPGVYEIEAGASAVLADRGRRRRHRGHCRGVLTGGYAGTWSPGAAIDELLLSRDQIAGAGGSFGAGIVLLLSVETCPVAETARLARWLAQQSARQCGPCLHGLGAIADAVEGIAAGDREQASERRLQTLASLTAGRGACAHPDGAVRVIASALRAFADDFEDHRRAGPCELCRHAHELPLPQRAGHASRRPPMSHRVRVNPIACEAHGICAELLPERITLDEWGYPIVDDRPLHAQELEHASRAARACPTLALMLARERSRAAFLAARTPRRPAPRRAGPGAHITWAAARPAHGP